MKKESNNKTIIELRKEITGELGKFISKIKCEICGCEEKRRSSNHRFCTKCSKKTREMRKGKYTKESYLKMLYEEGSKFVCIYSCKNCGIKRHSYKIKKRRFCKKSCQYKYASKNLIPHNKGKNKLIINCKTCGGLVKTYSWEGKKFCSRLCFEIDRRRNWTFPHKGKKIDEWMFNGNQLKLESYRKKLSKRMIKYFKEHPEIMARRRGKTLLELYGKAVAEKMKKILRDSSNKQWKENREYLLQTRGRFKKGFTPWNKGKKPSIEQIKKSSQTKEYKFLKKVGLNV